MTEVALGLEKARDAASRYSWGEAFEQFAAADAAFPLDADDLNLMAECAWWTGKARHCVALRERAFSSYEKAGDLRGAGAMATSLADLHGDLGEVNDAIGWLQRATRLLESVPEGPEHGRLNLTMAMSRRAVGDMEGCGVFAADAAAIGARHQDKDLFALGQAMNGVAIAFTGDPERGMPMIQEAAQGAAAGELGPQATGWIYCMMIATSAQLADWQSAGKWSEAATNWCNRQAINGFPGVCRVHRAEIMKLRGAFSEAEEEARVATSELASFNLWFSALAFRELGEIRVKMGDLDGAEEAFRQASELGASPHPGLALALLQRGRPKAAATALRRALAHTGLGPLDRAKLLPAQLEVALVLEDLELARTVAEELDAIASANHGSPALRALADAGAAAIALAEGALGTAEGLARGARTLFDEVDLSYEAARTAQLLGQILRADGQADQGDEELKAALVMFDSIGAVPDAVRTRELLAASA